MKTINRPVRSDTTVYVKHRWINLLFSTLMSYWYSSPAEPISLISWIPSHQSSEIASFNDYTSGRKTASTVMLLLSSERCSACNQHVVVKFRFYTQIHPAVAKLALAPQLPISLSVEVHMWECYNLNIKSSVRIVLLSNNFVDYQE